jgi:hypothetical protein
MEAGMIELRDRQRILKRDVSIPVPPVGNIVLTINERVLSEKNFEMRQNFASRGFSIMPEWKHLPNSPCS